MKRLTQLAIAFAAIALTTQTVAAQSSTLSKYDQVKAAVQEICPVTGKPLGSMGDPLKVKIGEEEIFLCCKGCTKGKIDRQHWTTIHANFAKAQGVCPVMEKALPKNPKSTTVNGQTVYICCPPCTKKIQADPTKYLTKVAGYYQASLKTSASQQSAHGIDAAASESPKKKQMSDRDQRRIGVQKICPVSGKPLGSMGSPVKVRAGELDLFLCCEGCKEGSVSREHWATIRENVAKAQGICPVMEKQLPAKAKSTVVNGQLVFVCCPPCTKKIAADPKTFLDKVDGYYQTALSPNSMGPTRR